MDVRFSPVQHLVPHRFVLGGLVPGAHRPGAFKRTIDAHNKATKVDAHNVKTLFNHGQDLFIGQKLLGDIDELAEDPDSPRSTVWLWDTSYNRDLLPGLRSGAYGSSFMFRVIQEEWNEEPGKSDYNPDGLPERTIKEARLFEAGPVTWPASPTATAGMRCISATDTYYEHLARQDPQRVDAMRSNFTHSAPTGPALRALRRLRTRDRNTDRLGPAALGRAHARATARASVPNPEGVTAMNLAELRARLEAIEAERRGIHEAAGDADLTDEQQTRWDASTPRRPRCASRSRRPRRSRPGRPASPSPAPAGARVQVGAAGPVRGHQRRPGGDPAAAGRLDHPGQRGPRHRRRQPAALRAAAEPALRDRRAAASGRRTCSAGPVPSTSRASRS
jgi:phage head maturation protease